MPTVIINGTELELEPHERLNGIQAARRLGLEIPHYCWHPGLSVVASCRMCLVESGRKDPKSGEVQMLPKLVPACQTSATDGTIFVTDSEKVRQARALVEEDLLLRHPID
ncbi:MAG TPA: 2Fe-2S iron-sulfur cluster-binding protein, partial [Pirellulaceae bacterium]